jgi:gamma-glutamyltranspeptidase
LKRLKKQILFLKQRKKQHTSKINHVKKANTTSTNEFTPLETTFYSIVHSTQQWVEVTKSIKVEIEFGPMDIARKLVEWQQFHSLI